MALKKATADANTPVKKAGRVQSDFPKNTLDEALRVPKALYEANGGQPAAAD